MIGVERRVRKLEQRKQVEVVQRFLFFFDVGPDGSIEAESAFDALRERFGDEAVSSAIDACGPPYRWPQPKNPRVYHVDMPFVNALENILTAPEEPGTYPYLCTFPGHWILMKGEMHVK